MAWIILLLTAAGAAGQEKQKKWSLNGYVANMQSVMLQDWEGPWTQDNLIHNRLNYIWFPSNSFTANIELRNRFMTGETVKYYPGYAGAIDRDAGFVKLSKNLLSRQSFLINSKIDRAYFTYEQDQLQIRFGRQRINWAQSFAWNPNDIFNTYSFFDFDYAEKPGADALKLQYYTGASSSFQLAAKLDSAQRTTVAALYHFNKWQYDFQLIGGYYNSTDLVVGAGFSGHIKDAALRGEASYFIPTIDSSGAVFVVSLGTDYTFKNALFLQFEGLYNQTTGSGITSFNDYYNMELSAKKLSVSKFSLFAAASKPITPLLSGTVSFIYYPGINGVFVGPNIAYSVSDNAELSLVTQSFAGQLSQGKTTYFHLAFVRFKVNF